MTVAADDRERALRRIAEHGVVGAGGAGFPTHVKLATRAGTLILNAAECEPLMHKDKELMRHRSSEVLAGLEVAARVVGASRIAIGVKAKHTGLIEELRPQLPDRADIVALTDTYPSGDEFVLVYDVTGRIIPPGGLPRDVDCAVINVETACNIGLDRPVTETWLTVAGAVARPCTVAVPVGLSFGEALALAGGADVAEPRFLSGGAMMGHLVAASDPIPKACGGILVLDRDHDLVRRLERDWEQIARIGASACDQCTFCTELCPRYLLGHPIEPHKAMRSLGFVEDREPTVVGTQFCCECNLCSLIACPEDLDPKAVCAHNKAALAASGPRWEAETHPYRAELHFADRRVPISRLVHKLGLRTFRDEGPLLEETVVPARVVLPLTQHLGAPAQPVVTDGARVRRGDLIARPAPDALGAAVHASIDGVCEVLGDRVVVRAEPPTGDR